ncbi:MAG: hypothetical protein ACI9EF_001641 [Pseudohongiellaceae bacterium]|jgi:hypothetical protein
MSGAPAPEFGSPLEARIASVGRELAERIPAVLQELPQGDGGPVALARSLGLDKVLASRLLKALRSRDPLAVSYHLPGPAPLRKFLRAARRGGAQQATIDSAELAVASFEQLIRSDVGDRSALDAIISSWLPDARGEFELRRKQAAHKAMSQLKGAAVDTLLATVLLHPSKEPGRIDIVWIFGLLGLRRLRPGVAVKFASRRIVDKQGQARQPTSLLGATVEHPRGLRLDDYCDAPPAQLQVEQAGDTVHYVLGGEAFGPRSAVDLVMAEVNLAELPQTVPAGSGRKGYVFAEVATPARRLLFDVLVHRDIYPGSDPSLRIYDTALDGVADVNDPARDIDRLELAESVSCLGRGSSALRVAGVPHYVELLNHVHQSMSWSAADFSAWRCHIDYPIYGSQVALVFDPPEGTPAA